MPTMLPSSARWCRSVQDDLDAFRKQLKQSASLRQRAVEMHLTEDEIDRFAVNRWRFPGVDVVPYLTRHYPLGPLFAHVVGYVSRIDADDLDRLDPEALQRHQHVGRTGMWSARMKTCCTASRVTSWSKSTPTDASSACWKPSADTRQESLSQHRRAHAEGGEDAFEGRPGAAVAIDPRNGQVLAMVSVPTFDPNLFVNGISGADYKGADHRSRQAADQPRIERRVSAGFDGEAVSRAGRSGIRRSHGRRIRCCPPASSVCRDKRAAIATTARRQRHGEHGARDRDCRPTPISTSWRWIWASTAECWMSRFSFGSKTGIDLSANAEGILPSREWKAKRSKEGWFPAKR
jgi:penicillin-binding protein 2